MAITYDWYFTHLRTDHRSVVIYVLVYILIIFLIVWDINEKSKSTNYIGFYVDGVEVKNFSKLD